MYKVVTILLIFIFPMIGFCQTADTILYSKIKCTSLDKFDKRPEPSFDLGKFIGKKLRYPDEAREGNIEGKVYIQFTIDETGKMTKPTVLSSPHQSLSDETIRFVGLMPAWSPAILRGNPVLVSLIMPVIFKLE